MYAALKNKIHLQPASSAIYRVKNTLSLDLTQLPISEKLKANIYFNQISTRNFDKKENSITKNCLNKTFPHLSI